MNTSQGVPKALSPRFDIDTTEVDAIMDYLTKMPIWPKIWIIFDGVEDQALGCRATLTPIAKPEITLQLTFWDKHEQPIGDRPIQTLREGIETALAWGFSIPTIRQEIQTEVTV